jgi:hypothetical protein
MTAHELYLLHLGQRGAAPIRQRSIECARRFRPARYEQVSPEPTLALPQDFAATPLRQH